jgi:hypothetical protein
LKVFDLAMSEEEKNKNPYYKKIIQSKFIRLVSMWDLPSESDGVVSLNLQKWESIIRVFNNVDYFATISKTRYEWGSGGVSIRVAKWISFRTGSSRWEAVRHLETKYVATGDFVITQKHLYFSSNAKSFRIPFSKIVSFHPNEDGITIQRDWQSAKPEKFRTNDGWFTNNLIKSVIKHWN